MSKTISINSLIADGLYEWDETKPVDEHGRRYLRRTVKGNCALAWWSGEDLRALGRLFDACAA